MFFVCVSMRTLWRACFADKTKWVTIELCFELKLCSMKISELFEVVKKKSTFLHFQYCFGVQAGKLCTFKSLLIHAVTSFDFIDIFTICTIATMEIHIRELVLTQSGAPALKCQRYRCQMN